MAKTNKDLNKKIDSILKKKLITIILSFIGSSIILGSIAMLFHEQLKIWVFQDQTEFSLHLISKSHSILETDHNYKISQYFYYNISTNDFVDQIKIEILFDKELKINDFNLIYSFNLDGYKAKLYDNYLVLLPNHHLNENRNINLYIITDEYFNKIPSYKPKIPQITLIGKDRENNTVYLEQ